MVIEFDTISGATVIIDKREIFLIRAPNKEHQVAMIHTGQMFVVTEVVWNNINNALSEVPRVDSH